MVKNPKFSVIIPVYNVENYLSECLNSVVNQTLLDMEIICVNDGTKDHSRAVLEKYQEIDSRVQIVDKENGGLSSARNVGLQVATGDYILFLDSDDYISSNACERLYMEVLEHKPDIIVFGAHVFPQYPKPDPWLVRNLSPRTVAYMNGGIEPLFIEHSSKPFVWRNCFKREFIIKNNLLFDESIRFAEDLIYQFMAFPAADKVIFIADKLYHYRWCRSNSLMANASKDPYQKYIYHIDSLHIIAQYWKKNGLLNIHKEKFMAWTVSFMGWDLYNYNGHAKNELIQRLRDFWNKYDLTKCKTELSTKEKLYYTYILKYKDRS